MEAYCMKCKAKIGILDNPKQVKMRNGRKAVKEPAQSAELKCIKLEVCHNED